METLLPDCLHHVLYYLTNCLFSFLPGDDALYPEQFYGGIVSRARLKEDSLEKYHVWCVGWRTGAGFDTCVKIATLHLRLALVPLLALCSINRKFRSTISWKPVFDAIAHDIYERNLRTWNNDIGIRPSYSLIADDSFFEPEYFRLVCIMPLALELNKPQRSDLVKRMNSLVQSARRAEMLARGPRRSERAAKRQRHE
jgi:hypothetical protein